MDAIYYRRGVIRPVVAAAKSFASALAIGSGAAVGREGPIIQIGSARGSTLGQFVAMPAAQRINLVAAGAGYPKAGRVLGVITKEHIADSVAGTIGLYPQ